MKSQAVAVKSRASKREKSSAETRRAASETLNLAAHMVASFFMVAVSAPCCLIDTRGVRLNAWLALEVIEHTTWFVRRSTIWRLRPIILNVPFTLYRAVFTPPTTSNTSKLPPRLHIFCFM